jgi:hypothetical protein
VAELLLQVAGVKANGFNPKVLDGHASDWWILLVLLISFTIIVILHVFDQRRFMQLMGALIRQSSVTILYREESMLTGRVSLLLIINYLLVISLFGLQMVSYFGLSVSGIGDFGIITLLVLLTYAVKIISIRFLGMIFQTKEAAMEYVYNVLLFNKMTGVFLFPVALLIAFAWQIPPIMLVWTGIVSISIGLLYRTLRLILIGFNTPAVSFFYIIIYLCTLELLPFVIMIKIFSRMLEP